MPNGEEQLVAKLFVALRGREGMSARRIEQRSRDAQVLLEMPVVRSRPDFATDPFGSCVEAVREAAKRVKDSQLLVVDASLGLKVLDELAKSRSLEREIPATLYATNILDRRRTLIAAWDQLHLLLADLRGAGDVTPPSVPSINKLRDRGGLEELAFDALANELLSFSELGERTALSQGAVPVGGHLYRLQIGTRQARAAVLGAAVMDSIFVIEQLPPEDYSRQALDFHLDPGGKGLAQAVASSRMGFDTTLISALGADPFGDRILDYIEKECHLTTEFVDIRADEKTAMTAVIVLDGADGASMALGWKGLSQLDPDLFLAPRYLDLLRQSDVLFITFEPPLQVVEAALDACRALGDEKPLVFLTPAPPYDANLPSARKLGVVDVVVANQWEAERLLARGDGREDIKTVAKRLLHSGIEALCVFDRRGVCTVELQREPVIVQSPMMVAQRGTAGARDAFCAALAHQILSGDGKITDDKVKFAMAAWSASIQEVSVPDSMPRIEDVWALLNSDARVTTASDVLQSIIHQTGRGDT